MSATKTKNSLVKAQINIKRKFKKAYNDRINQEKNLSDTFKPITSKIDDLIMKPSGISTRLKKENDHFIHGENNSDNDQWDYYDFDMDNSPMSDNNISMRDVPLRGAKRRKWGNDDADNNSKRTRQRNSDESYDEMLTEDDENSLPARDSNKRRKAVDDSETDIPKKVLSRSIRIRHQPQIDKIRNSHRFKKLLPEPNIPNIRSSVFPQPTRRRNSRMSIKTQKKIDVLKRGSSQIAEKNKKRALEQLKHTVKTTKRAVRTHLNNDDEPQPSTSTTKTPKKQKTRKIQDTASAANVLARRGERIASIEIQDTASAADVPARRSKRIASKELVTYGEGLESDFIPYSNETPIFQYFDDPNELCERLRLLLASQSAGNTNHTQEINSIVEELRELGLII